MREMPCWTERVLDLYECSHVVDSVFCYKNSSGVTTRCLKQFVWCCYFSLQSRLRGRSNNPTLAIFQRARGLEQCTAIAFPKSSLVTPQGWFWSSKKTVAPEKPMFALILYSIKSSPTAVISPVKIRFLRLPVPDYRRSPPIFHVRSCFLW